jgi:putative transposase
MRYSAIAPLITSLQDDYSSLEDFFRDASLKGVTAPDGSIKHYAPGTIEKWYRSYKQDGFNSLLPSGRSDIGKPRKINDELQE